MFLSELPLLSEVEARAVIGLTCLAMVIDARATSKGLAFCRCCSSIRVFVKPQKSLLRRRRGGRPLRGCGEWRDVSQPRRASQGTCRAVSARQAHRRRGGDCGGGATACPERGRAARRGSADERGGARVLRALGLRLAREVVLRRLLNGSAQKRVEPVTSVSGLRHEALLERGSGPGSGVKVIHLDHMGVGGASSVRGRAAREPTTAATAACTPAPAKSWPPRPTTRP